MADRRTPIGDIPELWSTSIFDVTPTKIPALGALLFFAMGYFGVYLEEGATDAFYGFMGLGVLCLVIAGFIWAFTKKR